MGEWKCGRCGKEYSIDELLQLEKVPMSLEKPEAGNTAVCNCGYTFHRDKWHETTEVEIEAIGKKIKATVSTVFLELNHGFESRPKWYETMVFLDTGTVDCEFCKRYETREEAEIGHDRIVQSLRNGEYQVVPEKYNLIID